MLAYLVNAADAFLFSRIKRINPAVNHVTSLSNLAFIGQIIIIRITIYCQISTSTSDKIPVGSISSTIRLKFFFAPGSNQEGALSY